MKYIPKLSILDFDQAYSALKKITPRNFLREAPAIIGLSLALLIAGFIFAVAIAQPQYAWLGNGDTEAIPD